MKPIRITMQSFGSYGKKTEIDFGKLNQNLFLITGDTGSGKSTIFDAVAFALYGEASSESNKKDGAELQSQYSDLGVEPYVELVFAEVNGGVEEIYTLRRVPRHVRNLKRGKGTTDEKEKVSLVLPDGLEFLGNKKETDEKIVEIVGLNKEQFMQVAMIAQNEFLKVIRSSSEEKKKIFRKLFKTEKFQKMVDELKSIKDEIGRELDAVKTECKSEIGHIKLPGSFDGLPDYYRELFDIKKRIIESKTVIPSDSNLLYEKLEAVCKDLVRKSEVEGRLVEAAAKKRDEARDCFKEAELLKNSFDQMEQSESKLEALEKDRDKMKGYAELVNMIRDSYEIKSVYDLYEKENMELDNVTKSLEAQTRRLPVLLKHYEDAVVKEKEAKDMFSKVSAEFAATEERIENSRKIFDRIDEEKRNLEKNVKLQEVAEKKVDAVLKQIEALDAREKKWKALVENNKDAAELLAKLSAKKDLLAELDKELNSANELLKEIKVDEKKYNEHLLTYKKSTDDYSQKNKEYMAKHDAFLDAQAGLIAKESLCAGKPCPVCGSTDHPAPAVLSEYNEEYTREYIEALAEEVAKLNEIREKNASIASALKQSIEERNAIYAKEREKVWNGIKEVAKVEETDAPITWQFVKAKLDEAKAQNEMDIELQKQRKVESDNATDNLKKAEDLREKLNGEKESSNNDLNEFAKNVSVCIDKIKTLEDQKFFDTREAADEIYNKAFSKRDAANKNYTSISKILKDSSAEKDSCEALIAKYNEEIPERVENCNRGLTAYELIMSEKEMSEDKWKDISDKYDMKHASRLDREIIAYKESLAQENAVIETAKKHIGARTKPDIGALSAAATKADEKLTSLKKAFDEISSLCNENHAVYKNLKPIFDRHTVTTEEYVRVDSMYNRFSGKVTGSRMDIETFVQRYYLERILCAANKRFTSMTSGQYEMRMVDIERAGDGKNRGLDLMVFSNVTGQEREIRTLSGGETFMAALCLALGMADQIQESVASINLDIMFIDEGFGSLSDFVRHQAVSVLQEMAEGEKLIGIISHVSELKQEIENQLIVRKDEKGSYVSWSIS